MAGSQATRLVRAALSCYPAHWRRRHGEEAVELAALLMRDGTPAASIALSYLAGAIREWLAPHPGRRLSAATCALLAAVCSAGVSAGILASTVPAKAASTSPPPAHCRPAPPAPALVTGSPLVTGSALVTGSPLVTGSAMSRQPMIFGEASHDRSC